MDSFFFYKDRIIEMDFRRMKLISKPRTISLCLIVACLFHPLIVWSSDSSCENFIHKSQSLESFRQMSPEHMGSPFIELKDQNGKTVYSRFLRSEDFTALSKLPTYERLASGTTRSATQSASDRAPLRLVLVTDKDSVIEKLSNDYMNPTIKADVTLLHWIGAFSDDVCFVRLLTEAGMDPNVADSDKATPLHWASAFNQNVDLIEELIAADANPSLVDKNGGTSLHWASALTSNPDVIDVLIGDAGIDPNTTDDFGWTPLHWASASNTNPDVISTLIDAGADPDIPDQFGWTPLHRAIVDNKNVEVIKAYLQYDVDFNAHTNLGLTPSDFARLFGKDTVSELLSSVRSTSP